MMRQRKTDKTNKQKKTNKNKTNKEIMNIIDGMKY